MGNRAETLEAELAQVRAERDDWAQKCNDWADSHSELAVKLTMLLAAVWDHAFVKGRDVKPEDERLYAVARRLRGDA